MTNDPKTFLSHVLTSVDALEAYTQNISEDQFYSDRKLQMASIKELEIIGEAVRSLPSEFKNRHPDVPWKDIAGMRSFLIHEYFEIDLDLVWDTIKTKVPDLKTHVKKIITENNF